METERRVAREAEAAVEQASLQWRAEMEETAREHEEEVRRLKAALAASGAPPAASPRSSSPMSPAMGSISEESRAEVAEARAREAEANARELSAELSAAEAANDQLGRRVAAAEEAAAAAEEAATAAADAAAEEDVARLLATPEATIKTRGRTSSPAAFGQGLTTVSLFSST